MGRFFNRRQPRTRTHGDAANTTTATTKTKRHHAKAEPCYMGTRPAFGQWLKHTWLDLLTMIALGAVGLGICEAHPAPDRSFAVTFPLDGEVVYPQFAYPLRREIIPIWAAALMAALIPISVILCMQFRIRSFWDVNNAVLGLLYSLITAAVFQVFLKWLIGGLRPHFLDVCRPDMDRVRASANSSASSGSGGGGGLNGAGFGQIYFTREICTGDPDAIDDSLESFPSGHTTAAFAGFVFLSLYLNAKLKLWSDHHPAMWKLVATYAPVLGATLIGGALTIDEYHNWYDVFAGAVIGTVMAFSGYRMTFAAIWDWRVNHIPLNRGAGFAGVADNELTDVVFTRRVGWGTRKGGNIGGGGRGDGGGGGYAKERRDERRSSIARKPVGSSQRYSTDHADQMV